MHLLEIKGLSKSYDGREVVKGVDILVKRGEIVGLLGPKRRRQDHYLLYDRRDYSA